MENDRPVLQSPSQAVRNKGKIRSSVSDISKKKNSPVNSALVEAVREVYLDWRGCNRCDLVEGGDGDVADLTAKLLPIFTMESSSV